MTDTARNTRSLGLGCVRLGHAASGGSRGGVRLIHQALDIGVAYFDTADSYGDGTSERVLGRALAGRRERAFVATKVGYVFRERSLQAKTVRRLALPLLERIPVRARAVRRPAASYSAQDFSVPHLRSFLEASLRRLRTDHVDLYQLHGPRDVCNDDVIALMSSLKDEGKIGGFGVGLESLQSALDWLGQPTLAGMQIPYGFLDPDAGAFVIPAAAAHSVPVIVRGAFASGLLARVTAEDHRWLGPGQAERREALYAMAAKLAVEPLQVATWFVTTTPGVNTLLVGTTSAAHLQQAVRLAWTEPPPGLRFHFAEMTRADCDSGTDEQP
jgi:aryl-alcohol dehydrogenase-like predicted oxidoreductase